MRDVLGVEVEAEEGRRDAEPEDRDQDRRESDDEADRAEVLPVEVARVDREQEDRDQARDDPAEPVDRRVLAQAAHLHCERGHLETSVEGEQAVGDPFEVMDLLDVSARSGA